jgi:membrane protease YdiL (CAAX protease family)
LIFRQGKYNVAMESILSITAVLFLIVVANVLARRQNHTLNRLFDVFLLLLNAPVALIGLGLLLVPVEVFQEAMPQANLAGLNLPAAGLSLLLAAGWGVAAALVPVRRLLARLLPLDADSPVHALALFLAGYLVGTTLFTLSQGGLTGLAETAEATSIWTVVISQLLMTLVALAGVGLGVRRNGRETGERLGLGSLRPRYLGLAAAAVVILVLAQGVVGLLWESVNPQESEVVTDLTEVLLGDIDTVWEWFLLALGAGVSEELLFRGALQPVLGLGPTAVLFAFLHVQYGFTPVNLFVLLLGILFGVIRQRTNTTVAILIHFAYNFVLGLIALLATYLPAG